jgi:L-cysteine/cystine lyase
VSLTLEEIRAELPVCEQYAFLNAGTFGPLPRRTVEAQHAWQERALLEGRAGHALFVEVMELRDRLRAEIGALIGAPPEAIALTTSTSEGCNAVVAGLRLGPEDEVVTTDSEHPGLTSPLSTSGARVRTARVTEAPAAEAFDLVRAEITPATKLIAISHVVWTTGQVMPVRELAGLGIPLLVDGAQGAGAIPVDVGELGCDFYTVSGQKWLLGPDTTGCLYVRPDWIERLAMTSASYLSWEDPQKLAPWPTARRFESVWLPPGSVAGLLASLDFAAAAGEERFEHARPAAVRCRELVAAHGDLVTEPGQATLIAWNPPEPAPDVVARLAERGVVVRDLPQTGWVRASCGFWTSDEDLDRLAAGLAT